MFLSTCQPETCVSCGGSLATLFPVLGPSQCVRLPCQSATRVGVIAWVATHTPILWVTRPGRSLPSLRAMHADHLLGRDPSWVVFVPIAFQRWCVLSRPNTSCTDPSSVGSLCSGTRGVAWKPPFFIYYFCLGCRGPRPPRPYRAASYCSTSSTVITTRGIKRGHPSSLGAFMVLNLGDARGQSTPEASTPEASQRLRPPRPYRVPPPHRPLYPWAQRNSFQSCYIFQWTLPLGPTTLTLPLGPTTLTLVDARGSYGT